MHTPSRTELPLTSSGSGCACCSTNSRETPAEKAAGVEYAVEGLTCGGCVATVEKAVTAIDGVDTATVELVPGGISRLIVSGPAGTSEIQDAVISAGYSLTK
jgi:copper chaperone CopZ